MPEWVICGISVLLFVASLWFEPFYVFKNGERTAFSDGPSLLVGGWMTVLGGWVAWLANPAWIASCACLLWGERKDAWAAASFSIAAVAFSVSFLLIDRVPIDTAVNYATIDGYGWGYYLWVLSHVVLMIGTVWLCWVSRGYSASHREIKT